MHNDYLKKMKRIMNRFLIIFLLAIFPLFSFSNSNLERWGDYIDYDVDRALKIMNLPNLFYSFGILGGIYIISKYDENWNRFIHSKYSGKFKTLLNISNEFGNIIYTIPAVGIAAGISLNTRDNKLQDAAFTSLSSIIISNGFVSLIKFISGRSRPEEGKGSYYFRPFSGRISFPSSHAASAFALITPWVLYYPNVFTYSLFIIPVGTGLARMAKRRHWASDVIAGSIIGFGVSYLLVKWHKDKYKEDRRQNFDNNMMKINLIIPL